MNPFDIPNELLLAFFQDYIRKSAQNKRPNSVLKKQVPSLSKSSNYENIDIGRPSFRHDLSTASSQDIVSIVWVGCLPYLFPDEEIPVCLLLATANIFLFRIFLPDSDVEGKSLNTLRGVQDALHCFYSFPLTQIREIVVSLFDQGFRIEVSKEGSRGTFSFLTRDASKTSYFLDAVSSVLGFANEKELSVARKKLEGEDNRTMQLPRIIYPDEGKIQALKMQLQEQQLSPFHNRENLISYCIVYERRDNDDGIETYDETNLPYLRSLILTNLRLILCDEDYVHWPLPSFVRSAPLTPQWIVDHLNFVENLIGIDVWEDMRGKQNMTGCYGVSVTFENIANHEHSCCLHSTKIHENESTMDNISNNWHLLFKSQSEREQFIRSVACLWKNRFNQDFKVTYSKTPVSSRGNVKQSSGNICLPSTQNLESPEMFITQDRARVNELFCKNISKSDEDSSAGVQHVMNIGCKPFNYPDIEVPVALILSKCNIYLVCASQHREFILANTICEDQGSSRRLYFNVIRISDLQQVVVGLFDQCFRLETKEPGNTFVCVTRNFDRTNEFIQHLSQNILCLPKMKEITELENKEHRKSIAQIFQMHENEDEKDSELHSRSEFIHPNSRIKFIYPSDETLDKLRHKIADHIQIMDLFTQPDNFGIVLYALIYQISDGITLPYTLIISEKFICLVNEDQVNYPLPMFVQELPDKAQYEVVVCHLLAALVFVEFNDFHSGLFHLAFNTNAVDPAEYEARFQTSSVEEDFSLVTDVNVQKDPNDVDLIRWNLQAHSHIEREKIFSILSKMWSMCFLGKTLPIQKKRSKPN